MWSLHQFTCNRNPLRTGPMRVMGCRCGKRGDLFGEEVLLARYSCRDGVLGVVAPARWRGWELGRAHVCPDGMGYSVRAYGEVLVIAYESGLAVGCSAVSEPAGVVRVRYASV